MSADIFESQAGRDRRSNEPEAVESSRKRRRKVLSCWDCRRRKLQCDRRQPICTRCAKAGTKCLYIEDAADLPERPETNFDPIAKVCPLYGNTSRSSQTAGTVGADALARLEYQDERIRQLESSLAQSSPNHAAVQRVRSGLQPLTPESAAGTTDQSLLPQDREAPLLRGHGFKTQFYGNTNPRSFFARIPDLASFTREAFSQYPSVLRVREDMEAIEARVEYAGSKHGNISDADLRTLLPSKPDADKLINVYLRSFGNIYQILHLPSFWSEYEAHWIRPEATKPHFIAIILCMIASVQCLVMTQPWLFIGGSSVARERAVTAIHAVENWLVTQSQKHVTAADFQLRFLLLFAKVATARKQKRTWAEAGDLLRFCMAAGLHRCTNLLAKPTSRLDRELRKRVWAAVTELELQIAFERGMLSAPWILQSDCPAPSHIRDEELTATSENLPAPRRSSEFTSVSFLAASAESVTLRTTLNTNLNSIRQTITFDAAKRYTDEIETHLQSLPAWPEPDAEIPSAMLSLNLRQYLLVLHGHQIRGSESKSERDYSRMVITDTATKIVDTHRRLLSKGYHALAILRMDHFGAALALLHVAAVADPHADTVLSTVMDQTAARIVPEVLEMLADKVHRLGSEQRALWILAASSAYVKSKKEPTKRTVFMQDAIDRITRSYYRIMACQDESAQIVSQVALEQRKQQQLATGPPVSNLTAPAFEFRASHVQSDELNLSDFNFDELAAWTFDDFAFDMDTFSSSNFMPPQQLYSAPPGTGNGGF